MSEFKIDNIMTIGTMVDFLGEASFGLSYVSGTLLAHDEREMGLKLNNMVLEIDKIKNELTDVVKKLGKDQGLLTD